MTTVRIVFLAEISTEPLARPMFIKTYKKTINSIELIVFKLFFYAFAADGFILLRI